ncbi:MAG: hypothetical protein ABIT81_02895 [Ferruginibacter sp.]
MKKRREALKIKMQIKLVTIIANAISEKYSFLVSKKIIKYTNRIRRGVIKKPQSTMKEFISVERIKWSK